MSKISNILKDIDKESVNEELSRMEIQSKAGTFVKSIANFVKKLPSDSDKQEFMFWFIDDMSGMYDGGINKFWNYATNQRFGSK